MKKIAMILSMVMLISVFGNVPCSMTKVKAEASGSDSSTEEVSTEEASTEEGSTQEASTELPDVESITLQIGDTAGEAELEVGEQVKVTATILPPEAAGQTLVWSSSKPEVAAVNGDGTVSALSAGDTVIKAEFSETVYGTINIHVKKAEPTEIYVKGEKMDLLLGDEASQLVIIGKYQIKDEQTGEIKQVEQVITEGLTYEVEQDKDNPVVNIDENGMVKPLALGTAVIKIVYSIEGEQLLATACGVEVTNPIEALIFEQPSVDLINGTSMIIKALYKHHDGTTEPAEDVTYTSSDADTVKVNKNTGEITALKKTESPVVIVAMSEDGRFSASYTVNVPAVPVTSITLNAVSKTDLTIGDEFQLEATVLPENATNKKLTYTVQNVKPLKSSVSKTVVTVGKTTGLVKIKGLGEATVVAKSADGKVTAKCVFQVYQNYFDVTKMGANGSDEAGDGTPIKKALKWACAVDEPITVYIPAGVYYIGTKMEIFSNTKLILDENAVLIRLSSAASKPMLQSKYESSAVKGYEQCVNVEICGGVWDGNASGADYTDNFYFGHARDIYIHDTTIKNNSGSHLIELAGVKNATIENVNLDGFKICSKKGYGLAMQTVKEAIQLDYCSKASASAYKPYDNTVCDSITIRNCNISNYMCGIGAHGCLTGVYLKNIRIENNTFSNITNCCIDLYNFKNVTIKNNTATAFHTFLYSYNSTGTVDKNKLVNKNFEPMAKSYRKYSNGIYLSTKSNFKILNNTIENCGNNGISIASKSKATIKNNKVRKNSQYGIKVAGATATIKGNKVSKNGISRQYYADSLASVKSDDIRGYYVALKSEYKYTGKAIKPKIKVAKLKKNKSFTVTYKKNKKLGVAQVIIKGKGSKKGKLVLTFRIVKNIKKRT